MRKKNNLVLRLASLLLVCVLISTYTLCGLLARYTSSGSGSDSARVIKFGDVEIYETASFTKDKLIICPGVEITKDVEVFFNGSESATYLFVQMDASNDWDSDDGIHFEVNDFVEFSIDEDEWTYLEGSDYVYYKVVSPNTVIGNIVDDKHKGVDVIKDGVITVSDRMTMEDLDDLTVIENKIKKTTVRLDFSAIVVQSNGFENVNDAWTSINDK